MHDGEQLLELDGFCVLMVFRVKGDEDSEDFEVLCACMRKSSIRLGLDPYIL